MKSKRVYLALAAVILALLVSACEITLEPGGSPPIPMEDLDIWNAGFETSYQDEAGNSYICDDYLTTLRYWFDYSGELQSWSSYLEGDTTGQVRGYESFYPYAPGVTYGSDHVEVTYTIPAQTAPLSVSGGEITPQSIVIVPKPVVIGHSRLYLNIDGRYERLELTSYGIPVISNC